MASTFKSNGIQENLLRAVDRNMFDMEGFGISFNVRNNSSKLNSAGILSCTIKNLSTNKTQTAKISGVLEVQVGYFLGSISRGASETLDVVDGKFTGDLDQNVDYEISLELAGKFNNPIELTVGQYLILSIFENSVGKAEVKGTFTS